VNTVPQLQADPIIGWRVWGIVPWENVEGRKEPRLTALAGGWPWPPGRATEAVCISTQHHDAPKVKHECGVYALRNEDEARQLAAPTIVEREYAIGRVSLWGRVVEHERGYRAQFAYPYAITVVGRETTARAIRDLYAVDVEHVKPVRPTWPKPEPLPPLPEIGEVTPDECLLAMLGQIAERCLRWPEHPATVAAYDVLEGMVWQRDPDDSDTICPVRAGYDEAIRRVSHTLQRLCKDGFAASGKWRNYDRSIGYRMTPAGLEQLEPPATVDVWTWWPPYRLDPDHKYQRLALPTDAAVAAVLGPPPLFAHEVDELRPQWRVEREAAQAKGRRYYRKWLLRWRAESGHTVRLYFDDDEVYRALVKAVKLNAGEPVLAAKVMDELAPGKWTLAEVARMSRSLVQLRTVGKVDRADTVGRKRWTVVEA
jgi:hypothetical protein